MTVSEQIIQVLDALGEKFGFAIDWTSENVIPYVETLCTKLISYEIWTSVAWMGIVAILAIVAIVRAIKRPFMDCCVDDDIPGGMFTLVCYMTIMAAVFIIGTQIFDIIKCVTFPEMYIFEYIQSVINAGR